MRCMTSNKIPNEDEQIIEYLDSINAFGDYVDYLIKKLNVSQVELAADVGTSQSAVSQWIRGKRFPTIERLYKICEVLDLSLARQEVLLVAFHQTRRCKEMAQFGKLAIEKGNNKSSEIVKDYSLQFDNDREKRSASPAIQTSGGQQ